MTETGWIVLYSTLVFLAATIAGRILGAIFARYRLREDLRSLVAITAQCAAAGGVLEDEGIQRALKKTLAASREMYFGKPYQSMLRVIADYTLESMGAIDGPGDASESVADEMVRAHLLAATYMMITYLARWTWVIHAGVCVVTFSVLTNPGVLFHTAFREAPFRDLLIQKGLLVYRVGSPVTQG